MKKCSKCKIEKNETCFGKRKNGLHSHCKECRKLEKQNKERKNNWYETNKDRILEKRKVYYKEEKEKIVQYKKEYYEENSAHVKNKSLTNYYKNHEQNKKEKREKSKTPEEKTKRKAYYRKYPFRWTCRGILRRTLKWLGKEKLNKTHILLGYSANELKLHIERLWQPEMNWENYGKWHIDHIKPICQFDKNAEIKEINALSNLQPLWATTKIINGKTFEGNLNKNKRYEN